jgi:hypothetical protein
MVTLRRVSTPVKPTAITDLQTQLENLLDTVWKAEASWRLDDKIDLAVSCQPKEAHA